MLTSTTKLHRLLTLAFAVATALAGIASTGCQSTKEDSVSSQEEATPASGEIAVNPGVSDQSESGEAAFELMDVPQSMRSCAECHLNTVRSYLHHGMSQSVSKMAPVEWGVVDNPHTGASYKIEDNGTYVALETQLANGAKREQRLIGRIGAGRFDVSFAAEELDPETGHGTGRLFFAPVEWVTGHGLELAPFDLYPGSPGVDMALNYSCLTCHTLDRLADLPDAATAVASPNTIFPTNSLGSNAFEHLEALNCDACHGSAERHVSIMRSELSAPIDDLGLPQLGSLSAERQLDRCARCHLQGDFRVELFRGSPDLSRPLAGELPTLVTGSPASDDFRFVGQLERLALSECFKQSPDMTCTTCHQAHGSVRSQGTESFDASCQQCHTTCSRPASAQVEDVTGDPARTTAGCVDCHVRRSQPFDLPHVRTADHFVRRNIPKPETLPHRAFTDAEGPLVLYGAKQLEPALSTPAGQLWQDGILAMGLLTAGRIEEAAKLFSNFPPPGTEAARQASAPKGFRSVELQSDFHQMRALALLGSGKIDQAVAAYSDALEMDPANGGARLARARILLDLGQVPGALLDTEAVIQSHPQADHPWRLRAELAMRVGRKELALEALQKTVERWPSDGLSWQRLAGLYQELGNPAAAQAARKRAETLGFGAQ